MLAIEREYDYTTLMQPEAVQSTLTRPQINSIKNKMAIAFMHTLNSRVNFHFSEADRDMDALGVDITIYSQTVGSDRTIASGANEIKVQLKGVSVSSSTMFSEDATHITYNLKRDLVRIGMTMYLIVVVLPPDDEIDSWRMVNDNDVLINARAYYHKVEGRTVRGNIRIPKTQQLNHDSYIELFKNITNEIES